LRKLNIIVLGIRGFPDVQGGIEKHSEELYPRLVKLGYNISVIARSPYIPWKKRVSEWNGVKFRYLWCPRIKSIEAIVHTFFGMIVARLISPDILHIHGIGPSILTPFAKLLGLKVIVTNHGPDYRRQKWGSFAKFMLKTGEYLGTRFADRVIVISEAIKSMLESKYSRIDLELISNGVNLPEYVPAGDTLKEYRIKHGKYAFTACRFVPEKGICDLIAAYKKIEKPGFKLVIAGDADHETEYSRDIKKLAKEADGIILTGFVSGRRLGELYSNAGLFVLPSYYEGLPIALLEALSYGLPVLASGIPGNREIDIPVHRFFPAGDIGTLAEKMAELFERGISEEEKISQKMMLLERYNWDKIAKQVFGVYKSVLCIG